MTDNSKSRRRKELAKIHIAKEQLGLDDETYREMLYNICGVKSAADLSAWGRSAILRHLRKCGFEGGTVKDHRGYKSFHKSAKASGMDKRSAPERAELLSKIGAILADLGLSWPYADGISQRMFGVEKVRWCYPGQLLKVTQALICYQKRIYENGKEETIYD